MCTWGFNSEAPTCAGEQGPSGPLHTQSLQGRFQPVWTQKASTARSWNPMALGT